MAASSVPSDVISWEDAMLQCGDDEEFLRELLADLRTETGTQLGNIEATIQNPTNDPFYRIMRSAHVIKGAAANLMCQQLRTAAMRVEESARTCHEQGGTAAPAQLQQAVQASCADLKIAAQNFVAFLQSIGV